MRKLLFGIIVLVPVTAHADTAITPLAQVTGDLTQIIGFALGTIVMVLITLILKKIHDKYGIDVPQAWLDAVQGQLDLGIAYADEQVNKVVAGSPTLTGSDKLNLAAKYVLDHTDDKALIALGEAKIKQMIESRLNLTRAVDETPVGPSVINISTPAASSGK